MRSVLSPAQKKKKYLLSFIMNKSLSAHVILYDSKKYYPLTPGYFKDKDVPNVKMRVECCHSGPIINANIVPVLTDVLFLFTNMFIFHLILQNI